MSNYPRQGQVYTVTEIDRLTLKDNPFLRVPVSADFGGGISTIQNEGFGVVMMKVIGDLKFRYLRTTDEWIPLFDYVGTAEELAAAVDFELYLDPHTQDRISAHVTVKGHYVEQDYEWAGDQLTACYLEHPYVAPQILIDARDRLAGVVKVVEEVAVVNPPEPLPEVVDSPFILNMTKSVVREGVTALEPSASLDYLHQMLDVDGQPEHIVQKRAVELARWAKSVILDYQRLPEDSYALIEGGTPLTELLDTALKGRGITAMVAV